MNPIPLGIYRHYKGNQYEVIGFAKHSEMLEDTPKPTRTGKRKPGRKPKE